jgi:hypothetical protein
VDVPSHKECSNIERMGRLPRSLHGRQAQAPSRHNPPPTLLQWVLSPPPSPPTPKSVLDMLDCPGQARTSGPNLGPNLDQSRSGLQARTSIRADPGCRQPATGLSRCRAGGGQAAVVLPLQAQSHVCGGTCGAGPSFARYS